MNNLINIYCLLFESLFVLSSYYSRDPSSRTLPFSHCYLCHCFKKKGRKVKQIANKLRTRIRMNIHIYKLNNDSYTIEKKKK